MTTKEFEKLIKKYKSEVKSAHGERPLTEQEIADIGSSINSMPSEYKTAFNMAMDNNFGKFEKLPHLLRSYLGALAMKKLREECGQNPDPSDPRVASYLKANLMNAALKVGLSAEKNAEQTKALANALDTYMNTALLQKTLLPHDDKDVENLESRVMAGDAMVLARQNPQKQLVLAKTLFLAQLGKYRVVSNKGIPGEPTAPLSETVVHGSRTNFVLPRGEDSKNVLDAFMGENNGADAGIEKRSAASHSVNRRSVSDSGVLSCDAKESRTFNPLKIFNYQYGLNIAIGGLGAVGPDKKAVTGQGESGHIYIRAEGGDGKHCGSLLIGIEGSAPGSDSYLGHTHGIKAKKARQSAFVSDKSIVGKKVGGRQVDLSGISSENLTYILKQFSEKYSQLQKDATTGPYWRERLNDVNTMLMGEYMSADKLLGMLNLIGVDDKKLPDIISDARRGYLHEVKPEMVKREKFEQSIRKSITQEEACSLADSRFAAAKNDNILAASCVKELIFTHETRSRSWKFFHPIKNYTEKSKISELLKKLERERGMSKADISRVLFDKNDTFTLNYGEGLSNDSEAVKFVEANKDRFKPKEEGVKAPAEGYFNKQTVRENAVNTEVQREEVKPRIENSNRTKIAVVHATENQTGKSTAPKVETEAPDLSKEKEI